MDFSHRLLSKAPKRVTRIVEVTGAALSTIMASCSTTILAKTTVTTTGMSTEELQDYLDKQVIDEARDALKGESCIGGFWAGIEWFVNWLRTKVSQFFTTQFIKLPVVGRWAARIGVAVSEFMFTVVSTFLGFLKTVFTSPALWQKAHQAALIAWTTNETNGLLAQIYAYGKKMASYFLEIIKQCLERAIVAHKMEVSSEEKAEITNVLDELLK